MTDYATTGSQYGEIAGRVFKTSVSKNCTPKGAQSYFDELSKQIKAASETLRSEGATNDQIKLFTRAAFESLSVFVFESLPLNEVTMSCPKS